MNLFGLSRTLSLDVTIGLLTPRVSSLLVMAVSITGSPVPRGASEVDLCGSFTKQTFFTLKNARKEIKTEAEDVMDCDTSRPFLCHEHQTQPLNLELRSRRFQTHLSSAARRLQRRPFCAQCTNHGLKVDLKGHKRYCPYKLCACDKCAVTIERRKINAKQIAMRREMCESGDDSGLRSSAFSSDGIPCDHHRTDSRPTPTPSPPPSRHPPLTISAFDFEANASFLRNFLEVVYPQTDLVSVLIKAHLEANNGDVNKSFISLKFQADRLMAKPKCFSPGK